MKPLVFKIQTNSNNLYLERKHGRENKTMKYMIVIFSETQTLNFSSKHLSLPCTVI